MRHLGRLKLLRVSLMPGGWNFCAGPKTALSAVSTWTFGCILMSWANLGGKWCHLLCSICVSMQKYSKCWFDTDHNIVCISISNFLQLLTSYLHVIAIFSSNDCRPCFSTTPYCSILPPWSVEVLSTNSCVQLPKFHHFVHIGPQIGQSYVKWGNNNTHCYTIK